jgi:hypothetical protein
VADRSSSDSRVAGRYRAFVTATLAKRIPAIIKATEEGLDAEAVKQLRAIARSIEADGPMVLNLAGWPFPGWEDMPARVNGKRPSKASFFDFEYWMYFRILQAVRFSETHTDPFRRTKHKDLDKHLAWAEEALAKTKDFPAALRLSLAANAHDLSQIAKPGSSHEIGAKLLDIDASMLGRLNIIADNFGGEFVGDLVLAIVAAEQGVETVLHVKQLPLFVSDTTTDDVTILLDRVGAKSDFGHRLSSAVRVGTIRFASHPFWASPQYFDKLPVEEMGSGDRVLTVVKGDLNFRRAIGDVTVAIETPFEKLAILPVAPMLSLRSIKSYCVAGITEWPKGLSRTNFPMDGSIVAVQRTPARHSLDASPAPVSQVDEAQTPLSRLRRWTRRGADR